MTQVTMRSGNTVSMTPHFNWGSARLNSNVLILDVLTQLITGRTGTQGLINPKKLCRTNGCVSDIHTCLGNVPEVVLTQNFWVRYMPIKHSLLLYPVTDNQHFLY